jgi:hypothetical protein
MRLALMIGTALLVASTALHAQAPNRFDCSKAKDPKACEERLAKAKAERERVRKACEGKAGADHSACVRKEHCAQAKDPAQCEAHAKERMAQRDRLREACKDKKGDDYRACVREKGREQHQKK